jgi:hypothetical protein
MVLRVDLAQRAFLRAQAAGEVAEVVDRQRDVGVQRLAHRLAVVHRLGVGQQLEVLLDAVGDLQQEVGALGRARGGPLRAAAWAASSASSMSAAWSARPGCRPCR